MERSFLLRSLTFILCVCFSMRVLASEDLKSKEKDHNKQEIKLLYEQAVLDYKRGRLYESKEAFKKILSLDGAQKKAKYYLDTKIPHKLVRREAIKQENLRVEKLKDFYEAKRQAWRVCREDSGETAGKRRGDSARVLFLNEDNVTYE